MVHWYTDTLVYWHTGILTYWLDGVREFDEIELGRSVACWALDNSHRLDSHILWLLADELTRKLTPRDLDGYRCFIIGMFLFLYARIRLCVEIQTARLTRDLCAV